MEYKKDIETAKKWCNIFGFTFNGFSNDSVFFYGNLADGAISYGSIIWTGIFNQLNDLEPVDFLMVI